MDGFLTLADVGLLAELAGRGVLKSADALKALGGGAQKIDRQAARRLLGEVRAAAAVKKQGVIAESIFDWSENEIELFRRAYGVVESADEIKQLGDALVDLVKQKYENLGIAVEKFITPSGHAAIRIEPFREMIEEKSGEIALSLLPREHSRLGRAARGLERFDVRLAYSPGELMSQDVGALYFRADKTIYMSHKAAGMGKPDSALFHEMKHAHLDWLSQRAHTVYEGESIAIGEVPEFRAKKLGLYAQRFSDEELATFSLNVREKLLKLRTELDPSQQRRLLESLKEENRYLGEIAEQKIEDIDAALEFLATGKAPLARTGPQLSIGVKRKGGEAVRVTAKVSKAVAYQKELKALRQILEDKRAVARHFLDEALEIEKNFLDQADTYVLPIWDNKLGRVVSPQSLELKRAAERLNVKGTYDDPLTQRVIQRVKDRERKALIENFTDVTRMFRRKMSNPTTQYVGSQLIREKEFLLENAGDAIRIYGKAGADLAENGGGLYLHIRPKPKYLDELMGKVAPQLNPRETLIIYDPLRAPGATIVEGGAYLNLTEEQITSLLLTQ